MVMIDYNGLNSKNADILVKTITENKPVKSFTVFFNNRNFLLTKHKELCRHSAVAVMEFHNGTEICIDGCNCGYGGHGPHNTALVLQYLGIPEQQAQSLVFCNHALQLYFDKDGKLEEHKTVSTAIFSHFESQSYNGQINTDSIDYFDSDKLTMYFVSPTGTRLFTVIQLLQVMQPTNFTYYVGNDNSKYIDTERLEYLMNTTKYHPHKKQAFVKINGDCFDVICFIDVSEAKTFINTIANALSLYPPFHETSIGGCTFLVDRSVDIYSDLDRFKNLLTIPQSPEDIFIEEKVKPKLKRPHLADYL